MDEEGPSFFSDGDKRKKALKKKPRFPGRNNL